MTDILGGGFRYAPLAQSIVVESRLHLRKELSAELQATLLFQSVHAAPSVQDGDSFIRRNDVDLCLIGPSIATERVEGFIRGLGDRTCSLDCAFVSVAHKDATVPQHAHALVHYPCSKAVLSRTCVEALHNSNHSHSSLTIDSAPGCFTASPAAVVGSRIGKAASQELCLSGRPRSMLRADRLKAALAHLNTGTYFFLPDGSPSKTTSKVVISVLDELLCPDGSVETDRIRAEIESALYQWLRDLQTMRRDVATARLRHVLRRYGTADESR